MIRVLIADDHPVVRDGLAALLASVDGMEVVGHAATGDAAIMLAASASPDVVLMDLHMPDTDGIEATRQIVASTPEVRVLVLTMFEDDQSVLAAMRAGASGYMLKGASQDEILRAIETVASGDASFSAAVAKRIVAQLARSSESTAQHVASLPDLTPRETEILGLLAAGRSNHAIARRLDISPKTVANHLSAVFAKLHVTDRTQAVIRAREAGLGQEES